MTYKCDVCNTRYAVCRVRSQVQPAAEHFYCRTCLAMSAEPDYLILQRAQASKGTDRMWFLDDICTFYDMQYLTAREYLAEVM